MLALLVLVPDAHAAPTPKPTPSASKSNDPCDMLAGTPAYKYCTGDDRGSKGSTGGGGSLDPTTTLDPMSSLANSFAKASAWVVTNLGNAVAVTSNVDFTNQSFLKTYSIVFAASTFLVLLLWLWAVMKRAIRGVPFATAFGEAIGLLWVTVLASAFTPLILYTVVSAVDGITLALAGGSEHANFFQSFSNALTNQQDSNGGPIVKVVLSLVAILAAGVLWLEMAIRAALLYVGAVLGTVVYSGLVDKELWSRVRRWVGIMAAIILIKPIVMIVLRLASALTGGSPDDNIGAIISGLSIIILSIIASAMIFRMVPGMGDDIIAARRDSYDPASRQAAAIVTKPVSGITQGINTHASRDSASRAPASTQASSSSVSHASGGIAAHSTRPTSSGSGGSRPSPSNVPNQDSRGGGRSGD
ncbi:hypothetical protein [Streptomyces sp. NBC_00847]|uniref:hypothetical protein n=1 Tax=Streptomyces sp. NBC_00847 TaxID=2975850 RepID=UPI00225DDB48|nr:hypothetical protein [Streptomyces sp. NBC_00847]MCX4885987.1 hypothetical protein [Streptomyces sp. NBC_00847]